MRTVRAVRTALQMHLAEARWRHARPALERAPEVGRIRKSRHRRHLLDSGLPALKLLPRQAVPHLVGNPGEGRPLACQVPTQRAVCHLQCGGDGPHVGARTGQHAQGSIDLAGNTERSLDVDQLPVACGLHTMASR